MSTVKNIGSIWLIAASLLHNTIEKKKYFVYLGKDGTIFTVDDENEQPEGTNYVATVSPESDPLHTAACLKYQAQKQ